MNEWTKERMCVSDIAKFVIVSVVLNFVAVLLYYIFVIAFGFTFDEACISGLLPLLSESCSRISNNNNKCKEMKKKQVIDDHYDDDDDDR